jgi:signal transduction histidine kinase
MSKILIVDDDPTARATIESILMTDDYLLDFADDGHAALEKAHTLRPDLILLDVMMPNMDGFEVCRRIRSTPGLVEVPIILLTALDDSASRLQGIEAGADDFLSKPVDRQELRVRVRTITRLNRYRTLLEQRESLREMAQRLVTAQEEERKRISRELHDDLGQLLTAHKLNLHKLQGQMSTSPPEQLQVMDGLISETNDIIEKIRALARDLRPPLIDALGLPLAITSFCQEFTRRSQIPVELDIDPDLPLLPDHYTIILYRVLQETMTNVIRHAGASRVWVELSRDDGQISLTVQDNGRGFSFDPLKPGGIGLIGIRERLALAGGDLNVHSHMGQGSVLSAYLPLNETEADS